MTKPFFASSQKWSSSARPPATAIRPGGIFHPSAWRTPNPGLNNGSPSEAHFLTGPLDAPPPDKRGPHMATLFPAPQGRLRNYTDGGCSAWAWFLMPVFRSLDEDRKTGLGHSTSALPAQFNWEHGCVLTGCVGAVESSHHGNHDSTDAQRCRRDNNDGTYRFPCSTLSGPISYPARPTSQGRERKTRIPSPSPSAHIPWRGRTSWPNRKQSLHCCGLWCQHPRPGPYELHC